MGMNPFDPLLIDPVVLYSNNTFRLLANKKTYSDTLISGCRAFVFVSKIRSARWPPFSPGRRRRHELLADTTKVYMLPKLKTPSKSVESVLWTVSRLDRRKILTF
jgi:hypothetical protein